MCLNPKMEKKMEKQAFNDKVAMLVTSVTGNMWFFWAALCFVVLLRTLYPPQMNTLLLNIENDLQLLLLAANAVVGGKQTGLLIKIINHVEKQQERQIQEEERIHEHLETLIIATKK